MWEVLSNAPSLNAVTRGTPDLQRATARKKVGGEFIQIKGADQNTKSNGQLMF